MSARFTLLVCGIILTMIGISVFAGRFFYSWKYGTIDFGSYHSVFGVIFVTVGLIWVVYAVRRYINKKKD
jgi:hypothetical protein